MTFKVLVLTPGKQLKNGNAETAGRVARMLNTDLVYSTDDPEQTLKDVLSDCNQPPGHLSPPTNLVIFALHAYKSAAAVRLLFESEQHQKIEHQISPHSGHIYKICKLVIILGGTDVNEMSEATRPAVESTLKSADSIVSFTQCLANELLEKVVGNEELKHKLQIIPQTYELEDLPRPCNRDLPERFCLLIGNLRPVKDHLLLLEIYSKMPDSTPALVICGNQLSQADSGYCEQVLDRIKQLNESSAETVRASSKVLNVGSKRILLMSGIQHSETLDLIEKCEVLINTSRSEGMSSSLVHGMRFGKPILAKSINANIELLGDDYEGLFSSVSDAVTTLGRLFELESGDNASTYLLARCAALHDPEKERQRYTTLLPDLERE